MENKKFNELNEQEKQERLDMYAKEREVRGTVEVLARLVSPAKIKDIKGDARLATFRFASFNKAKNDTEFFTASAYIAKGKAGLESFYQSLTKGQLVAVEYKHKDGYNNVYQIMDRSKSDTRKKNAAVKQAVNA